MLFRKPVSRLLLEKFYLIFFKKAIFVASSMTPSNTNTNSGGGGLWNTSSDAKDGPVAPDVQTQLIILNQMLQKEREEEIKRRADEEERQRQIMEAKEVSRLYFFSVKCTFTDLLHRCC